MDIKDIAQALDLPYSSGLSLCQHVAEATAICSGKDRTGVYRIGLAVIELAGVALNQLDVRVHGLAYLDHLADVTRLNANLAVLTRPMSCNVGYAVRSRVPRMYTILGRRTPAHLTALGKAMLAYRPFWEVKRLIEEHGWRPRTPKSICSFPELERELNLIRQRGYALDDQEQNLDTRCVGAPIRNRLGSVIGAISVLGAGQRCMTEERLSELAHAVLNTPA
jgi:DNA-binding IclR family transcriptional regulator